MCTDAIFFCDEVAVSERAEDWDKARVLSGKCGCSFESSWRDSADCIRSCLYLVWSADYVLVLCALFRVHNHNPLKEQLSSFKFGGVATLPQTCEIQGSSTGNDTNTTPRCCS